jgi:proteasome lid subunit RPN8/RPN11
MTIKISRTIHELMLGLAAADATREICGLLLGSTDNIEELMPTANIAENPSLQFEIDPSVLIAAYRLERSGGRKVVGYYHSHPNGLAAPSATDAAMAAGDGRIWLIIGSGEITAWRATAAGFDHLDMCWNDNLPFPARSAKGADAIRDNKS